MLVRQILGLKGGSEVVTLSKGTKVSEAAKTLSSKRIGAIVVVDGDAPEERADRVWSKMTEGRFRHMPVMEGGAMVGLISIGDVVKARLSELSMEKHALEDMIKGF